MNHITRSAHFGANRPTFTPAQLATLPTGIRLRLTTGATVTKVNHPSARGPLLRARDGHILTPMQCRVAKVVGA